MTRLYGNNILDYINQLREILPADFWNLLMRQGSRVHLEKHHQWAKGYYDYKKYEKGKKKLSKYAAKMGNEMLAILLFKEYLTNDVISNQIINRLTNNVEAPSLIFEFRIAAHFKMVYNGNVELRLIPLSNQKTCDLIVEKNGLSIEVECSRKQYKENRSTFSLANYLHKKAPQLSADNPGLIAIQVPEYINWAKIRDEEILLHQVKSEFQKRIFSHVSLVIFCCDDLPDLRSDNYRGEEYYDTSILNFQIPNDNSKNKIPDWYRENNV